MSAPEQERRRRIVSCWLTWSLVSGLAACMGAWLVSVVGYWFNMLSLSQMMLDIEPWILFGWNGNMGILFGSAIYGVVFGCVLGVSQAVFLSSSCGRRLVWVTSTIMGYGLVSVAWPLIERPYVIPALWSLPRGEVSLGLIVPSIGAYTAFGMAFNAAGVMNWIVPVLHACTYGLLFGLIIALVFGLLKKMKSAGIREILLYSMGWGMTAAGVGCLTCIFVIWCCEPTSETVARIFICCLSGIVGSIYWGFMGRRFSQANGAVIKV